MFGKVGGLLGFCSIKGYYELIYFASSPSTACKAGVTGPWSEYTVLCLLMDVISCDLHAQRAAGMSQVSVAEAATAPALLNECICLKQSRTDVERFIEKQQ